MKTPTYIAIRGKPGARMRDLRRRARPFMEVGESARGALDMARAMRWAERRGVVFEWENDADAWADYKADVRMSERRGEPPQEAPVEIITIVATDPLTGATASLGGIEGPDESYYRRVQAELALELAGRVGVDLRKAHRYAADE